MNHPLTRPVYTTPKLPEFCGTCHRKARWMRDMQMGNAECSFAECPHRKKITAQPRDRK